MPIKLAASPLSWMNADLPSLGADCAVEHCLSEIALIGYEGVEFEHPFLKLGERLPEVLAQRGLSICGGWHSTFFLERDHDEEMQRLDAHIALLQSLNADVVTLAECTAAVHQQLETGLSERPQLSGTEWQKLGQALESTAQHIKAAGLRPVYHHHMGTCIQSAADISELMQRTENLELLLDTGHLAYAGSSWMPVFEAHAARIGHVHCKDVRKQRLHRHLEQDTSFLHAVVDGVFTVPGDPEDPSDIDFTELIQTLLDQNYNGWVVMEAEQDPNKADPFTYASMGYQTLVNALDLIPSV